MSRLGFDSTQMHHSCQRLLFYLLGALTAEPVFVSEQVSVRWWAVDLAARFPEHVRMLVAHEPPATQLLPDAERARAIADQVGVEEVFRHEGIAAAMKGFAAIAGLNFEDRGPDVKLLRPSPERVANLKFFLTHDAPAVRLYRLDPAVPICRMSGLRTLQARSFRDGQK